MVIAREREENDMGTVKADEIAGYHVSNELVCTSCFTNDDEISQGDIILWKEVENTDDVSFCDRCGKKIA